MSRLFQYQHIAEPVSLDPERSTPDKWLQQRPDIIFDEPHQQYLYQALSFDPNPVDIAETITVDKWLKLTPDLVFDKFRQQFSYPTTFDDAQQLTQVERTTPDKWLGWYPDINFDRHRQQYSYTFFATDNSHLGDAERPQADKAVSYYSDIVFDKLRLQHSYPYWFGQEEEPIEEVSVDSWYVETNKPRWDISRITQLFPYSFQDANSLTASEATQVDKWLGNRPDVIFDKLRQQFSYPFTTIDDLALTQPEVVSADRFIGYQPALIFAKDRTAYLKPSFTADAQLFNTAFEIIGIDKWGGNIPSLLFDLKRQQHIYPSNWLGDLTGLIETLPINSLFKQADRVWSIKRHQWLYPYFFEDMGLLFVFVPPLTAWADTSTVTTDFSATSPNTTGWSAGSALDFAGGIYDEAEAYDTSETYDDYTNADLDNQPFNPPDSDWNSPSTGTTDWTPEVDPDATDWDAPGGSE